MLKQAAIKTGDIAGDGTTTATLLAREMINMGLKKLNDGSNAVDIKKGIDKGESIILFHDRCESTLAILENLIVYCHEKGLKFKTINNA